MSEATLGRQPVEIVEVITPSCANVHGSAPCTATETGDDKCYNTRATCNDADNYQARPLAHLTPDLVLESGDEGSHTENGDTAYLIEVDLRIPNDPSGLVFEIGGTSTGVYIGFTSGNLIVRAGDGSGGPAATTVNLSIDPTSYEGTEGTLIVELVRDTGTEVRLNAYLFDPLELTLTLLGEATASDSDLFGSGDYGVGTSSSAVAGNGTEDETDYNGTITAVRLYTGQTWPDYTADALTWCVDFERDTAARRGFDRALADMFDTISGAANGTYIDADGIIQDHTPGDLRITHDYQDGSYRPRLLVEEGATNICPVFDFDAATAGSSINIATTAINALGLTGGVSITDPDATCVKYFGTGLISTSTDYVCSVYVYSPNKVPEIGTNTGATGDFVFYASVIMNTNSGVEQVGPDLYRCWATDTSAASFGNSNFGLIWYTNNSGDPDMIFAGFQCEPGTYPTSPIKTTSGSVTRTDDDVRFDLGAWYNDDEGTWLIEYSDETDGTSQVGILGEPGNNRTIAYSNASGAPVYAKDLTAVLTLGSQTRPGPHTVGLAYENGVSTSGSQDGVAGTQDDATFDVSGVASLQIGNRVTNTVPKGAVKIKRIGFIASRISNSELDALTRLGAAWPTVDVSEAFRQRYFFDDGRKAKPSDDIYRLPLLTDVSAVGSRLNLTGADQRYAPIGRRAFCSFSFGDAPHTDFPFDQNLGDRTFDPLDQGTFWPKWLVRNKFGKTRALVRVYRGYEGEALADMRRQTYVLDKVSVQSGGRVRMEARDYLSLTEFRRAQVPAPSSGALAVALTDVATTALLDGDVTGEYPATGTLRIEDELMTYTGRTYDAGDDQTDFTGLTRGTDGSTAEAHDVDETVQLCRRYTAARIDDVLDEWLITDAQIPAQLVDSATFTSEYDETLPAYTLTGLITEPTAVDRLIGELAEECSFYVWWDERDQIVTMQAIKPLSSVAATLTQEDNIIADTFEEIERPTERITTISFYYNPRDRADDLRSPRNYDNQIIVANSETTSVDQYGKLPQLREIFSRWLTTNAQASQTASRLALRYADVPRYVGLMVDAKDRRHWVGDFLSISHDQLVDENGARDETRRWLVVEAEEVEAGHMQRLTLTDITLDGRIFLIAENGTGTYNSADFANGTAFIADNSGLNADGSAGATIG